EEYLVRERGAEAKSEYLDGEIVAMVGASRAHNLLTINVAGLLWQQLGDRPCEVYSNDMRVKIPVARVYTYPDVVVSCDDPLFEDDELDTLLNPIVIVEVLSASTESYDRGKKFSFYRSIPSLIEYVLVAQDEHRVEHYLRQAGGHWLCLRCPLP
ncbi:MAG TPA: Uma2 family endonuclease, partial [Ardenticatenaceae bacterium]|nr:Uma2 family endonuclease [Ardenticatenaceae bacterium]